MEVIKKHLFSVIKIRGTFEFVFQNMLKSYFLFFTCRLFSQMFDASLLVLNNNSCGTGFGMTSMLIYQNT